MNADPRDRLAGTEQSDSSVAELPPAPSTCVRWWPRKLDQLTAARDRVARLERELAAARAEVRSLEGAQAPGVTAASPTAVKIALFQERFAGRTDVYALPWTSRTSGKKGWSPAVPGGFYQEGAELLALDDAAVDRHLRGDPGSSRAFHIGLYPMLPGDRCRLLACDFDGGDWQGDAAAFVTAGRDAGVDSLAEISRSGDGAHVWIFFDAAVAAADARALGARLLRSAMATRPSLSMASYDRFFPAQDSLPPQRSQGTLPPGQSDRAALAG